MAPEVETGFVLPDKLMMQIRSRVLSEARHHGNLPSELLRMDNDIWWTCGGVPTHTDSHPPCFVTTGLILINDANGRLVAANRTEDREFDLPVGSIYRLEAHRPHGVVAARRQLFCFLAWDCHILDMKPLKAFAMEVAAELGERFL